MGVARQPRGPAVDHALARVPVEHRIGHLGQDPVRQLVSQPPEFDHALRLRRHGMPDRGGQPDDRRDVQRARTHITLLATAVVQRGGRDLSA